MSRAVRIKLLEWRIHEFGVNVLKAMPWLRRLVACLPQRRPGFDPGSVHVGFVVDKVALGQVFPRVLRFSPVIFIPPVLHYLENEKYMIIFLSSSSQGCTRSCGASVASTAGPCSKKKVLNIMKEDAAIANWQRIWCSYSCIRCGCLVSRWFQFN